MKSFSQILQRLLDESLSLRWVKVKVIQLMVFHYLSNFTFCNSLLGSSTPVAPAFFCSLEPPSKPYAKLTPSLYLFFPLHRMIFSPDICMGFSFTSFGFYHMTAYQGPLFYPPYLKFNLYPQMGFIFFSFFPFALITNTCMSLIYNIDYLPPFECNFHRRQGFSSVLYPSTSEKFLEYVSVQYFCWVIEYIQ